MWVAVIMVAIAQAEPPPLRVALKPGSTCATAIMEVAKLDIPTVPSAAPPPVTPPPVMLGLPDVLSINGLRYRREA